MEKPLVDNNYLLRKYPGKGGWTYAVIPEIAKDLRSKFGWVRVKGTIDSYAIKNYCLMPMGNGNMFLPVKTSIRKIIKKQEGDSVQVILYPDNDPLEIPEDLQVCLNDNPEAQQIFDRYKEGEQKLFVNWIIEAKTMDTKVKRITVTLNKISRGMKFYDRE